MRKMAFLSSMLVLVLAVFGATAGGSMSAQTAVIAPIVLICAVDGPAAAQVPAFTEAVCAETLQQLATATGRQVVASDTGRPPSSDTPTVTIILTINTPYAAKAQVKWTGGSAGAGESPVFDTGSDDAPLNVVGAAQLAMVLVGQVWL